MKIESDPFTVLFLASLWVSGWVFASGFWSTFFAVIFPPWGWYLVAERILTP